MLVVQRAWKKVRDQGRCPEAYGGFLMYLDFIFRLHVDSLPFPHIHIIQVSKGHCKLRHDGETLIEFDDW